MYKVEKKILPQVFGGYFQKPAHPHNTCFAALQNNYAIVRITSAKEKSLLKYIGPKVWADIPLEIKNAASLKVFIRGGMAPILIFVIFAGLLLLRAHFSTKFTKLSIVW